MSKSIPCGLLAFAVSSSLAFAQGDKPAASSSGGGWTAKPGEGIKYDGGDAFSFQLRNRLQVHWTYANNEDNPDRNTFSVRRARTTMSGHVFDKNIMYYLMFDAVDQGAAGDGNIKQGWAQWNFSSSESGKVGLRAGQAKTMYGLEATMTSAGLWFVERSAASRVFADTFSRGAWINGVMAENKFRFNVGAMNTDVANGLSGQYIDAGEETANSDNELSYVFSANFDPLGDFFGGKQTVESGRQGDWRTDDKSLKGTVGAGLALGNGKDTTAAGPDIESTSININTAWNVERFNILGEYFMRTDDPQAPITDEEEAKGFSIGGGYLMEKSGDSHIQWGFGVRYAMVELDAGDAGGVNYLTGGNFLTSTTQVGLGGVEGDVSEISLVANAFYHGHPCKTQFEYTLQDVDPTGGGGVTNHIIRVAFQIEF